MNALDLDLLPRVAKTNENALISPYSIQSALAMTYAGADGETKAEMAKVLHYPVDDAALHRSFDAFVHELNGVCLRSAKMVEKSNAYGGPSEPISLNVANRLYGQSGYAFRSAFLTKVQTDHGASFQAVDFRNNAEKVREEINQWVAQQTHERIRNVIPPRGLDSQTRLTLVNAVWLKAPWAHEFSEYGTKTETFFVDGKLEAKVPTMQAQRHFGFMRGEGFSAVTIRYVGEELQLLVLLPNKNTSVTSVEKILTPQILADCAKAAETEVILHLPKFKIEPQGVALAEEFQVLGMMTAFDKPKGSANFDRMVPRKPNDYLLLSNVFHKAFIEVDEKGTEAAAATVVTVVAGFGITKRPKPVEMKVDRPFLFAIQHRASGACLFLGRVVDPR
ncbi:MAG: serpin family protein [Nibricoccus sp.]